MQGTGDGQQAPAGFLRRLVRNTAGNTLALVAAALIPLTAMIGSGLDMARGYMAQDRLQQACDAGVLAARKMLSGPSLTTAVETEANNYFNFNFPQGSFSTATFKPTVTVPQAGTVKMVAATTVPTAVMRLFGYRTMDIGTTCQATQDFVSTDVMLVLDMSGSMNCPPGPSYANSACNETEASGSKMQALRDATMSLYDTLKPAQDQLHDNNLRLRFGFVPYNSTVNVGKLVYAKDPNYIRNSNPYQSRYRSSNTAYNVYRSTCEQTYYDGDWTRTSGSGNNATGTCTRYWVYDQVTLDTSVFKTGGRTTNPATGGTNRWLGCIEERQTDNVSIDGGTATTAPTTALDLDIDMIPNSDASRWAPWWAEVQFNSGNGQQWSGATNRYCASEASRLREYYDDRSTFKGYLDALVPLGGTYHDVGMIWGARFLSPDGIFKSASAETNNQFDVDNPKKIRGFSVRKYMIFMTDGDMAPSLANYSSYGIEQLDRRVLGPSANNQLERHLQRFRMACNAAKSQNIDVWVVAFSTSLTTDMQNCASRPEQASGIATNDDLIKKFKEIGSKIGSLRLSE